MLGLVGLAVAGPAQDCAQSKAPKRTISGCKAALATGRMTKAAQANAHYNIGNAYRQQGQIKRAIAAYDAAAKLAPKNARIYVNRGVSRTDLGQPSRAIKDLSRAIKLDPKRITAHHNRAIAHRMLKRHKAALKDFERAMRLGGRKRVRRYQEILKARGFYTGALDGLYGPGTRGALVAYIKAPK